MNNTVLGVTFTIYGGYGFEGVEIVYDIKLDSESLYSKKGNFQMEDKSYIINDKKLINRIMKYMNENEIYQKLRNELENGPIIKITDGPSFDLEFTFVNRTEVYILGRTYPDLLFKLENKFSNWIEL